MDPTLDLHLAVSSGQLDRVRILLTRGQCDVDSVAADGQTPLQTLTLSLTQALVRPRWGLDMARLLLEHHANPNVLDSAGDTPLINAVSRGNSEIALLLLEHEADPNLHGKDTAPPFFWACRSGLLEVVKVPIAKGTPTNVLVESAHSHL